MSGRLDDLLNSVVDVLFDCGWVDEANWFLKLRDELKRANDAEERQDVLSHLEASLVGMGSFSDLPLVSQSGRWTKQELRDIQWDLAEKIRAIVDEQKYELSHLARNDAIQDLKVSPAENPSAGRKGRCPPQEMNPRVQEGQVGGETPTEEPPEAE